MPDHVHSRRSIRRFWPESEIVNLLWKIFAARESEVRQRKLGIINLLLGTLLEMLTRALTSGGPTDEQFFA